MEVNMRAFVPILGMENSHMNYGVIKGQVKKQGLNYPCYVSVHEHLSRRLIEMKFTDEHGFYEFSGLSKVFRFMLIATDASNTFNAVIQDNVVPK